MNPRRTFLIFMLINLLLTGCWGQKELTDISLVSAIGIDLNDEGRYFVTFQIVNPENVAIGKRGGVQSAPVFVFDVIADTIAEAGRKATKLVSRRLYFAHTNLIVISEELARKEGIQNIFDALDRDPEFRTTTNVIIAHETKAANLVNRLTGIEKVPASKVIKTLETSEKSWGEIRSVNIQEVIKALVSPDIEPVISGFKVQGNTEKGKKTVDIQQTTLDTPIEANGIGIFKNGKLIDWFEGETARGAMFIFDKIQTTNIKIDWEEEKNAITYDVLRQTAKVSAHLKNDLPTITIHVRVEGDLGEVRIPIDVNDLNKIKDIEKSVAKEIKEEIEITVERAQKNKSDVLGFGKAVHLADSKVWKELKQDWNDVHFPELEVNVIVDTYIRGTGLRNKSYLSNMEE